ncbi:hypothetical protein [Dipodfec virus UOA04_Rod_781]|nr:hypothetical protein [Dipodfec virus UOA04_Rod_781]
MSVSKVPCNVLKQNCFVRECVPDAPVCSLRGNTYVSVDVIVDPETGDSKLNYSNQEYPITPEYVKSFYSDYRTNLEEEMARPAPGKNLGDISSMVDFLKNIANPEFVTKVNSVLQSLSLNKNVTVEEKKSVKSSSVGGDVNE